MTDDDSNYSNDNDPYGVCVICKGIQQIGEKTCPYCNGSGEWNQLAETYLKTHICQCIFWDRKFCPICKKKCHHDTPLSPKCTIDSGYGGMTTSMKNEADELEEEDMIVQ